MSLLPTNYETLVLIALLVINFNSLLADVNLLRNVLHELAKIRRKTITRV